MQNVASVDKVPTGQRINGIRKSQQRQIIERTSSKIL
jgi:hypothetical protein